MQQAIPAAQYMPLVSSAAETIMSEQPVLEGTEKGRELLSCAGLLLEH